MCASFLPAVQAAPGVPPFPPLLVAAIHTALKISRVTKKAAPVARLSLQDATFCVKRFSKGIHPY